MVNPRWHGPIAMLVAALATAAYMQFDPGWHFLDGFEWAMGLVFVAFA